MITILFGGLLLVVLVVVWKCNPLIRIAGVLICAGITAFTITVKQGVFYAPRNAAHIPATKAFLNSIKIPSVEFNQASVGDAISFLEYSSDLFARQSGVKPPIFLLDVKLSERIRHDLPACERDPEPELSYPLSLLPLLTFNATNVSLLDMLIFLENTNACRYELGDEIVILKSTIDSKQSIR